MVFLNILRVIIGIVLLLYGGAQLGLSAWLAVRGVQTDAVASSYVDYGVAYAPVVDYTTREGRRVRFESRPRPTMGKVALSENRTQFIRVYYDPQTPDLALLADSSDMWVWPGTLFVIGVLTSFAGVIARLVWDD